MKADNKHEFSMGRISLAQKDLSGMERIVLGLGKTASCPDELMTDEKQYYWILIQAYTVQLYMAAFYQENHRP